MRGLYGVRQREYKIVNLLTTSYHWDRRRCSTSTEEGLAPTLSTLTILQLKPMTDVSVPSDARHIALDPTHPKVMKDSILDPLKKLSNRISHTQTIVS